MATCIFQFLVPKGNVFLSNSMYEYRILREKLINYSLKVFKSMAVGKAVIQSLAEFLRAPSTLSLFTL